MVNNLCIQIVQLRKKITATDRSAINTEKQREGSLM